jgi:hypothetical protein
MKECEMDRAYSTHGIDEKLIQILVGNTERRRPHG